MAIPAPQSDVARFLTTLAGAPPRETHISAVFIGRETVWKLKKAVRLPFLNFTTLSARHHFLLRELELNKPAAPGIYRDVVPITRQPNGSLSLGDPDAITNGSVAHGAAVNGVATNATAANKTAATGAPASGAAASPTAASGIAASGIAASATDASGTDADETDAGEAPDSRTAATWTDANQTLTGETVANGAVDWVLRMARVPDADFLDVIVAQGRLTPPLLRDLGDCVFTCHARLSPVPGWDSVASMRRIADGNAGSARAAGLPEARIAAWHDAIEAEITRGAEILRQRAGQGAVRRCHGDLHLGNLCLWQGSPVAFDALEFDEDLATIDVAYDLAFLLMDLDLKVGRAAANQVMNRYVARSGDAGVLAPMPMFLSQRAFIRAHVSQTIGEQAAALRHLTAAEDYLRPRSRPRVIAIGGLQGTGKSTLARILAPELESAPGALVVRSDEVRKRLFGASPEQHLPAEAYTEAANTRTNAAVVAQAAEAARSGHSVIVDSTFLNLGLRQHLEQAVAPTGACFIGIWLEAPLATLEQRIRARQDDASDATEAVLRKAAERGIGRGDWAGVDASGNLPTDAIRTLLRRP